MPKDAPAQPNALFRKYRPQTFGEVLGQGPNVTNALSKVIKTGSPKQTYLLLGPRGTGKTTTARIFAKALNCLDLQGFEPCNKCESCDEINRDVSLAYEEINCADDTSVDSMRNLVRRLPLATNRKWKVIALDEVHRLSPAAQEAILKPIEEPPAHVIWLLGTTDPKKVKDTIRSRAMKLPFKLLPPDLLGRHLQGILDSEGVTETLEDPQKFINAALLAGRGSARDTLTALDAYIDSDAVPEPRSLELIQALADVASSEGDPAQKRLGVFKAVANAVQSGIEARDLAEDTIEMLRELFFVQMNAEDALTTPDWGNRSELAQRLGSRRTVQAMDALGAAVVAMRSEYNERANLEIHLARFCVQTESR